MEGHAKSAPISRLPLITILDTKHYLRHIPVCQVCRKVMLYALFFTFDNWFKIFSNHHTSQAFHLELNFFSKENRILHYPVRAFYVEGVNLMAYNLSSGADTIYKKLYTTVILIIFVMKRSRQFTSTSSECLELH